MAPTSFSFAATPEVAAGELVARIPAGLTTTQALLDSLAESLRLPAHFGFNWNALHDCLCDLSWIKQRTIVLIHDDLPAIPVADLRAYVGVLEEVVADWLPADAHSVRVAFPASAADPIDFLLRSSH